MNPKHNLDRILESAIIASWPDLMRGTYTGLIHIEYAFAPTGGLDYMKVWTSITRGHWLLACEYWMSANTFHGIGIRFDNGYKSEGLARILEFVMQHQNSFVTPPNLGPARIAANSNAHRKRERSGCDLNKRSHPRSRVPPHGACRRLTLTCYSFFF